jgi:alpha-L-rhamnosidase
LFSYLASIGRNDLIYTMATQKTYPGWGCMLEQGATTVWEEWNGNNSRLHSTLMAIGNWFSEGVGGVRPDPEHPGYKRFLLQPGIVGEVNWARNSFNSPYGQIRSEWRYESGRFKLDLQVPPNSSALVSLPARSAEAIREQGRPLAKSAGVRFVQMAGERAVLECASGHYRFEIE